LKGTFQLDAGPLVGILAVFVLVATNGFFVAAEFGLVKVRRTRIDELVAEGKRVAKVVQDELRHMDNYIAATQLGITLASLALGWIGEPSLAHLIEPLFAFTGGTAATELAHSAAIAVSFFLITMFHIVLGELVPKSIALQRSEGTTFFVARPLYLFARLFRPFIVFMNGLGNLVVRAFGLQTASEHGSVHTVKELEMLVAQSHKAGLLDNEEEVLLRRIFDFGEKTAQHVMVPRTEIVGVSQNITFEQLRERVAQERYTRFPVYEGTLDNIIGLVHIKDVFTLLSKRDSGEPFAVQSILRPVLMVPKTTAITKMMTLMQHKKAHLAVVISEYGETAGIVTLEDILEEIVGEVQDEFDTLEEGVRSEVEILADGSYSVDGLMTVDAFADRFGVTFGALHSATIAGYVFGELGRIPKVGDSISIGKYRLQVEAMDHFRIARLRVKRIKHESVDMREYVESTEENT
jgi:magnesium and cobalt exporter, CNNM family